MSSLSNVHRRQSTDDSYEFETYKTFSLAFYTTLMGYADELQAVSVDEALIDVTGAVNAHASMPDALGQDAPEGKDGRRDPAVEVAEKIRDEVRGLTQGCEGGLFALKSSASREAHIS